MAKTTNNNRTKEPQQQSRPRRLSYAARRRQVLRDLELAYGRPGNSIANEWPELVDAMARLDWTVVD